MLVAKPRNRKWRLISRTCCPPPAAALRAAWGACGAPGRAAPSCFWEATSTEKVPIFRSSPLHGACSQKDTPPAIHHPLAMPRSNKKAALRGAAPPQSAGRGKELSTGRNLKPSAGTVGGAAAKTGAIYRLEILQLEPCALRKRGGDDDDYFKGGQACCSSTRVAACLARCPVPTPNSTCRPRPQRTPGAHGRYRHAQPHLPPDHSARPRPVFAGVRASGTPRPRPRRGGRVHRQRVRHALARGPARWAGGSAVQPCSLPGAEDVYNSTGVGLQTH